MEKAPSRLFGLAPALAAGFGIYTIVSVDLSSEEALSLQPDDLADLKALGASDAVLEALHDRALAAPDRMWRLDLQHDLVTPLV